AGVPFVRAWAGGHLADRWCCPRVIGKTAPVHANVEKARGHSRGTVARIGHETYQIDGGRAVFALEHFTKRLSELLVDQIEELRSVPAETQLPLHCVRFCPARPVNGLRLRDDDHRLETAAALMRPTAGERRSFFLPGFWRDGEVDADAIPRCRFVRGQDFI